MRGSRWGSTDTWRGDPAKETSSHIAHLIVPDGWIPTRRAGEGMADGKLASAGAGRVCALEWPVVPEVNSVTELSVR